MSSFAWIVLGLIAGCGTLVGGSGQGAANWIRFDLITLERSLMKQIGKYLSAFFIALLLVTAVGCASTAKQEGTGEYVDDSVITTKVKAAIFEDAAVKSSEVSVETFKGVVQLSGFISSQAAMNRAVEVARKVGGVKSVKNDMRLK